MTEGLLLLWRKVPKLLNMTNRLKPSSKKEMRSKYIFWCFDEQGKNIELSQLDADQKKAKAAKKKADDKADVETGAPTLETSRV